MQLVRLGSAMLKEADDADWLAWVNPRYFVVHISQSASRPPTMLVTLKMHKTDYLMSNQVIDFL